MSSTFPSNHLTPFRYATPTYKERIPDSRWNQVGSCEVDVCTSVRWQGFISSAFRFGWCGGCDDFHRPLAVVAIKSVNAPWANSVPIKTPFLPPWGNQSGGHLRLSANINGEEFRPPIASGLAHRNLCYGWIWTQSGGFVFIFSVLHCGGKERERRLEGPDD